MVFKQTIASKQEPARTAAPAQKKAGGRFSGIRPKPQGADVPLIKQGDYIFDFVRGGMNRKRDGLVFDGTVIESDDAWEGATPAGQTGRFFLNFGDYSDESLVSLCMALCDYGTPEELEQGEPDFDVLVDAICNVSSAEVYCRPGEKEPAFGVNPVAGIRILLKLRNNRKGTIDKNGEPYKNAYFERCPEEHKQEAPF